MHIHPIRQLARRPLPLGDVTRSILSCAVTLFFFCCTMPVNAAAPPVTRYALPNGLQVWHLPRAESQSVALCLLVNTGSRFEDPKQKGISHFVEHMCFEGTEKYGVDEGKTIEIITSLGGEWNAQTAKECTSFWARVPAEHFTTAVDWLSQIAFHPTFPEKKLEKVRSVIFEEKGGKSRWLESRVFAADVVRESKRSLFPGSPLSDAIIGETKTLSAIQLNDLTAYHKKFYAPNNAVLIVVGNVDADKVRSAATTCFGDLPMGPPCGKPEAPKEPSTPLKRVVMHGWSYGRQGCVVVAARKPGINHPDNAAFSVLTALLNQSLMKELHFNQGLAYEVRLHRETYTDAGYFGLFARAKRTKLARIEKIFQSQLDQIRNGKIDPQKVEDAKRSCLGRRAMSTEGNPGWMARLKPLAFAYSLDEPLPDVTSEIAAVKPEDLVRVVKEYFAPERTAVTVQRPPF